MFGTAVGEFGDALASALLDGVQTEWTPVFSFSASSNASYTHQLDRGSSTSRLLQWQVSSAERWVWV